MTKEEKHAIDTIFDSICKEYPNDISAILKHCKDIGVPISKENAEIALEFLSENGLAYQVENTIGGDIGIKASIKGYKLYSSQSLGNGLSSFLESGSKSDKRKRQYKAIHNAITLIMSMIGGVYALHEIFCK